MTYLDATTWGPHFWGFLHTVSFSYPITPSAEIKKRHYELIRNLPTFIPIETMASSFEKLLDQYPVTSYLDNRESFVRWTWFIHNKINEQLEKPKLSLSELYERNKPIVPIYKHTEKIMFAVSITALSGLIYYLYDK
jgi:FAD-linked sulfhydryl oxidase